MVGLIQRGPPCWGGAEGGASLMISLIVIMWGRVDDTRVAAPPFGSEDYYTIGGEDILDIIGGGHRLHPAGKLQPQPTKQGIV